jgi:hypothetical protein
MLTGYTDTELTLPVPSLTSPTARWRQPPRSTQPASALTDR